MEELKPCPFCKGEAHYNRKQIQQGYIVVGYDCKQCGAAATVFTGPMTAEKNMKIQATEAWNRRAEPENKPLITVEQVQEFYEFLQGNIPYNDAQKITFTRPPKISKETAVDIIYYLQEVAHIIPDTYESCKKCGDFFDSDNDGCLAGFCECCGCQHPEFVEQEDGCVKCDESLYARKPEGSNNP